MTRSGAISNESPTYFPEDRWVQVRTVVLGNVAIRTRVFVDENTRIARGIEQVALSNLRERESVEVIFRSARTGIVKADTIYVRPESAKKESQCPSSLSPQTNFQSSMQQTHPDRNQFAASQITVYGHTDIFSDVFLTFDRLARGQEPLWRRTSGFLKMRAANKVVTKERKQSRMSEHADIVIVHSPEWSYGTLSLWSIALYPSIVRSKARLCPS